MPPMPGGEPGDMTGRNTTSHRTRRAEMGKHRSSSWCLGNRIFGIVDMDSILKKLTPVLEMDAPYFQPDPPSPIPDRSKMSSPRYHDVMRAEHWKYYRQVSTMLKERSNMIDKMSHRDAVHTIGLFLAEMDRLEKLYQPFLRYVGCKRPSPLTVSDASERMPISKADREYIIKKYGCTCAYCGGEGDDIRGPDGVSWHIDHIIPHSWGGEHDKNNFALSCRKFNLSKRNNWWQPTSPITSRQMATSAVLGGH